MVSIELNQRFFVEVCFRCQRMARRSRLYFHPPFKMFIFVDVNRMLKSSHHKPCLQIIVKSKHYKITRTTLVIINMVTRRF